MSEARFPRFMVWGSLVDIARPDHQDVLEELQPWLNGSPLEVNSLAVTEDLNGLLSR